MCNYNNNLGALPAVLIPIALTAYSKLAGGNIPIEQAPFIDAAIFTSKLEGVAIYRTAYLKAAQVTLSKAPFELKSYIQSNWNPADTRSTFWRTFVRDMESLAAQNAAAQGNPFAASVSSGMPVNNIINPQNSGNTGTAGLNINSQWIITGIGAIAFVSLLLMGFKEQNKLNKSSSKS